MARYAKLLHFLMESRHIFVRLLPMRVLDDRTKQVTFLSSMHGGTPLCVSQRIVEICLVPEIRYVTDYSLLHSGVA